MKRLLIISFDILRNRYEKSYAISSILAFLKNDLRYKINFDVDHLSINMLNINKETIFNEIKTKLYHFNLSEINYIAISAYVWNEFLINPLIYTLKKDFNFKGKIILGGYQITYSSNQSIEYPNADCFISGYAEQALLDILTKDNIPNFIYQPVDFSKIPSPYLTNEIPIIENQKMVRFETKRGCPYNCSFCAHRDLITKKVYNHSLDKIFRELALFNKKNVQKINFLDPIFNIGKKYLEILEELVRINFKPLISLQTRFEMVKGEKGKKFLDLCEKLNVNLEFGLQTAIESESKIINRKNNITHIKKIMQELNYRNIKYEISLIYGLPTQTLDSFKYSINFIKKNGCTRIKAYPLMLLKGTELFMQKKKYKVKEKKIGIFDIPVVVESNSFNEKEWLEMKKIAESLNKEQYNIKDTIYLKRFRNNINIQKYLNPKIYSYE